MAFLSFLGNKKSASVLGVDIGSSSLKVVQLRKEGGKAVLETYGELALGPYGGAAVGQATNLSPEQITETLKDLLREAKVTAKECGVSIPYARSLLSLVTLPRRNDPAEQKTVIELEARKFIPMPISEVQLDWFIVLETELGATPSDKIEVLLVAVQNDELKLLESVVKGAGLAARFYEIEIFSTIRAAVEEPLKPVMVLDIGAGSTKTYIVERGIVARSHSIPVGSQDITRALAASANLTIARAEALKKEEGLSADETLGGSGTHATLELVFSRIFSEAKRLLMQYETESKKPVSAIVLAGGGGVTKELGEYAKRTFSIDVRIADPFNKTEAPAFMRPVLEEIGPEFTVAVGLALRQLGEG